jgi:hypothetical protein
LKKVITTAFLIVFAVMVGRVVIAVNSDVNPTRWMT